MSSRIKISLILSIIFLIGLISLPNQQTLPVIAIANYGPHSSLNDTINGIKQQLAEEGFIENKTVRYVIKDVGFDSILIPQMLASLQAQKPQLLITLTTPVSQMAKSLVKNTPIIFTAVTDPVQAGLLDHKDQASKKMTGSSDQQNLEIFLAFAKTVLPHARRIGLLYSSSESNDHALLQMMRKAAAHHHMSVVAVTIDHASDVPMRMSAFKNKVDFIYVGASGPIQPTLPAISAKAKIMQIPLFNVNDKAVMDGLAMASMGVDYIHVGRHAGKIACAILNGENITNIQPIYPSQNDHVGLINEHLAEHYQAIIPKNIKVVN